MGCSPGGSTERLNAARASVSAMDTLLKRMASTQVLETASDSLEGAGQELLRAADTSASITAVRVAASELRRTQSRQVGVLRENAAHRAAEYAAAKTHMNALRTAIDSLPSPKSEVGAVARAILTWPFAVILLIILMFGFPDRLQTIIGRIRSIRLLSSEVVLNEQTTSAAEETFESLRKQAKQRYKNVANKTGLDQQFVEMMNTRIRPLLATVLQKDQSLRSTIYIPDILFAKHLAQAVDYWPRGGGRGRAFPVYFGMIGKAWRLRESRIEGHVTTDAESLILNWGMTHEEALAKGKDRESFAAIVLKNGSTTVGILYMDCKTPSAFGEEKAAQAEFERQVLGICNDAQLISTLGKLREELGADSSPIDLQLEP